MRAGVAANSIVTVVSLVTAAACAPRERPQLEQLRVEFLAPADGDTVSLPVTIRLAAYGVTIVPASGLRAEGEGHHHLAIDAEFPPPDQPIPVGNGYVHLGTGATEWVLDSLAPGTHRLIAIVAWGDHVPVSSVAADTITIVVR